MCVAPGGTPEIKVSVMSQPRMRLNLSLRAHIGTCTINKFNRIRGYGTLCAGLRVSPGAMTFEVSSLSIGRDDRARDEGVEIRHLFRRSSKACLAHDAFLDTKLSRWTLIKSDLAAWRGWWDRKDRNDSGALMCV